MTTTTLPNLAGVIKTTDIYKKMKFDYVAWAKTAQDTSENTLLVGNSVLINPLLKKVYHLIFSKLPMDLDFLWDTLNTLIQMSKLLFFLLQLQITQIDLYQKFLLLTFKIHIVDVFVPVLVLPLV